MVAQLASEFNLEVELKNIILVAFRFFEFLHSQGQSETSALDLGLAASTLKPDIPPPEEKGLDLSTRITEGIVTEGQDPASRFRDLLVSVSAASRARPAEPDAPSTPRFLHRSHGDFRT